MALRLIAALAIGAAAFGASFLIGRATATSKPAQTTRTPSKHFRVVVLSPASPKLVRMPSPASLPALAAPPRTYTPPSTSSGGGGTSGGGGGSPVGGGGGGGGGGG